MRAANDRFRPIAGHALRFFELHDRPLQTGLRAMASSHLIAHAIKFTPTGTIMFRVRSQESGGQSPSLPSRAGQEYAPTCLVRFEVEDTGIGIAPEDQEKILRDFEQAGAANFRAAGTGLGLAISRKLVQMMGGSIHVQSQLGQGNRFWFELNVPEVSEAVNGLEAIQLVSAWVPDVILMDTFMPELSGIETARRIRQLSEHAAQVASSRSRNLSVNIKRLRRRVNLNYSTICLH